MIERLRRISNLEVVDQESAREAEHDFGGLTRGRVLAGVRPTTVRALVELVELARTERIALTPRGLGSSQSGQSLATDGVSVDMRGFVGVDLDGSRVRCGSAVTWRQLLAHVAPHGFAPEVVPLNLDITIGGTLSVGGMGSTSHRHGMAVSSVESIEVVTGAGEHVHASWTERSELLHAVLGGLGLFGFITAVTLRLRPMAGRIRTYFLLYDDLPTMLADEHQLTCEPACMHIEGFASAAVQGTRLSPAGRRIPFARWFYGLQVSTEYASGSEPDTGWLASLRFREVVHTEDTDGVEHASRYDPRFQMMRGTGMWTQPHPWLECMLPRAAALEILPELIPRLPLSLGDGHRIMFVADVPRPSLLMHPEGAPIVGLAVLPMGVSPGLLASTLPALREAHDRVVAAGGKRYLSGWLFDPNEDDWRRHYGDRHEMWSASKHAFDPDGILCSVLRPR